MTTKTNPQLDKLVELLSTQMELNKQLLYFCAELLEKANFKEGKQDADSIRYGFYSSLENSKNDYESTYFELTDMIDRSRKDEDPQN